MRVILLGRKPIACAALRHMLSRGIEVVAVAAPGKAEPDPYPERLVDVAESFDIPVVQDAFLYDCLAGAQTVPSIDLRDIDLVISILHQRRIRRPLIKLGRIGCVNFHPAPLPEYRGWGTYNMAILGNVQRWGASAHFVDENFDTGPIIRVRYFDVDTFKETALSLERRTQPVMLALFKEVLDMALELGELSSTHQGEGRSFSKRKVMELRYIKPDDSIEMVERKIRAFWFPPYPGAQIQVAGRNYKALQVSVSTQSDGGVSRLIDGLIQWMMNGSIRIWVKFQQRYEKRHSYSGPQY